jgi:hypothetical protein
MRLILAIPSVEMIDCTGLGTAFGMSAVTIGYSSFLRRETVLPSPEG